MSTEKSLMLRSIVKGVILGICIGVSLYVLHRKGVL